MSLKIVVLAKQVPDTRNVGKDAMKADGTINRAALPAIFNPEDLNALEQALRLKDAHPGSTVTILTMGPGRAAEVIREGMFRGADNGYLLTDRAFAGAQFVGMGKDLYENSALAKELFEKANDILGYRITDIMFNGTDEDLRQTKVTQPAVFLHSVISALCMGDDFKPEMTAGHSLGEFSALVAAGALSFEDGLKLVYARADCVEWRADWFEGFQSPAAIARYVQKLRVALRDKLLLVTFRTKAEGGEQALSHPEYLAFLPAPDYRHRLRRPAGHRVLHRRGRPVRAGGEDFLSRAGSVTDLPTPCPGTLQIDD